MLVGNRHSTSELGPVVWVGDHHGSQLQAVQCRGKVVTQIFLRANLVNTCTRKRGIRNDPQILAAWKCHLLGIQEERIANRD